MTKAKQPPKPTSVPKTHKPWCGKQRGFACNCAPHRSDCDCASCDGERTR